MQLSYDYAKDRALMCLRANYESHLWYPLPLKFRIRSYQDLAIEKNKLRNRLGSTMKLKNVKIRDFKRFTDLTVQGIPETARLIVLAGPNGCGKSSFFDALYTWYRVESHKGLTWQPDYHVKSGSPRQNRQSDNIIMAVHDSKPEQKKKMLYVRTAYRNDPEFTMRSLQRDGNPLDRVSFERMIDNDKAVSRNYQRLVSQGLEDLYTKKEGQTTFSQYREESFGEIRELLCRLFPNLKLDSLGNPLEVGTFCFTKGESCGFMFKNLSGGEKAAFDLILDFVIAQRDYNNTIFCIDEPESHMHASLQAKLLSVLYELVPENCQLVLATHSIGMMRQALDIEAEKPKSVVFLDFGGRDFDMPQTIEPATPNRKFWKKAYDVAFGDLAGLVAPSRVVICEGEPITSPPVRSYSFDARCYERIFEDEFPGTEFISMGNDQEILGDRRGLAEALRKIIGAMAVVRLVDHDDRTDVGVEEANRQGVRVLSRRNLESYLLDDEVLRKLATANGKDENISEILAEKEKILASITDRAEDDLKPARGQIYVACKKILGLTRIGNNAEEFMRETLAPLIKPGMKVYDELRHDIFDTITTQTSKSSEHEFS